MSIQHLGTMTWTEAKAFVHERVVALVPLGSILAHGPHLPLNTDVVISGEMVRRAARKMSAQGRDVLVYPPVVFTPAPLGRAFAGTVSVDEQAHGAYLLSLVEELKRTGLRRVVLVSVHTDPSNVRVLDSVSREAFDPLRVVFPDITREPWRSRMPEEFRSGGAHAGEYETSCMLALQPDKVREDVRATLPPVTENLDKAIRAGKSGYAECGGRDAYFGTPSAANASAGERYLDALAEIVVAAADAGRE